MSAARWAHPGLELGTSKLDEAIDRGFDPGERDHPPAAHLDLAADDPWAIALSVSVEEAQRLRGGHEDCGVVDCGEVRCSTCDERMTCLGPEPRACGTTCGDCPCDCSGCLLVREDMRADLLQQLERESR